MSVDFQVPEVETERLRLRLPRMDDFEAYAAFRASPRSVGVGGPFDRSASFQSLSAIIGQWHLRGYGRWLVADKSSDAPFGIVGVFHPEDWPEPEIAWSIFDHAEGRGIAFEAARATRDYVYRTLGWRRIVSMIAGDNTRSMALAERMGCKQSDVFEHPTFGLLTAWIHPGPEASI